MNSSVDWVGLLLVVSMLAFWGWLLRRIMRKPGNLLLKWLLLWIVFVIVGVMLWNVYVALRAAY